MRGAMCLIGLALATTASRADDRRPLFNGNDLSGWRANRDADAFTVKNGVLRVQASAETRAHLF
jgi:hypothetical protein